MQNPFIHYYTIPFHCFVRIIISISILNIWDGFGKGKFIQKQYWKIAICPPNVYLCCKCVIFIIILVLFHCLFFPEKVIFTQVGFNSLKIKVFLVYFWWLTKLTDSIWGWVKYKFKKRLPEVRGQAVSHYDLKLGTYLNLPKVR